MEESDQFRRPGFIKAKRNGRNRVEVAIDRCAGMRLSCPGSVSDLENSHLQSGYYRQTNDLVWLRRQLALKISPDLKERSMVTGPLCACCCYVSLGYSSRLAGIFTSHPGSAYFRIVASSSILQSCFILLAGSAFIKVIYPERRLSSVSAAAIVLVIGLLTVLEFGPARHWRRQCNIHRMGFDAQQFSRANVLDYGGQLCCMLRCSDVYGVPSAGAGHFTIAHTFPLSLGLDVAYWLPVRNYLYSPFSMGSQMALQTASAFTLYGIVMLAQCWRSNYANNEDLPRWTPAIAYW